MTQVQDMTDQQLNRALAELMGYTVKKLPIGENGRQLYSLVTPSGRDRLAAYTIESAYLDSPNYCTDPAASLEVQAKAIEVNSGQYLINLSQVTRAVMPKIDGGRINFNNLDQVIIKMLTASPRERAEASYITLSQANTATCKA